MLSGKGRIEAAAEAARVAFAANPHDLVCFPSCRVAVSDRERRRGRNGSGIGYRRLRGNDRSHLFWDLFHSSFFLCDHEDFYPTAQKEATRLDRARRTDSQGTYLNIGPITTESKCVRNVRS